MVRQPAVNRSFEGSIPSAGASFVHSRRPYTQTNMLVRIQSSPPTLRGYPLRRFAQRPSPSAQGSRRGIAAAAIWAGSLTVRQSSIERSKVQVCSLGRSQSCFLLAPALFLSRTMAPRAPARVARWSSSCFVLRGFRFDSGRGLCHCLQLQGGAPALYPGGFGSIPNVGSAARFFCVAHFHRRDRQTNKDEKEGCEDESPNQD